MENKTAVIFGSTGFIGRFLVEELINNGNYSMIKLFVRNKSGFSGDKIKEYIIDLNELASHSGLLTGDDLYICLGTTIKKAGSVRRMEEIDRDLPVRIATLASLNGIKRIAVVSSIGASSKSSNYYLRIKGEMEEGILGLKFEKIVIARPAILLGNRKEKRPGEIFSKGLIKIIGPLLIGRLKKYRGIYGEEVAKALIRIVNSKSEKQIYESDELVLF
jgi:uncharacterized protein YbjT (DUF2867 family)